MNKTTIIAGVFAAVVITAILLSGTSSAQMLSGKDFVDAYEGAQGATLIDVRTPAEYQEGHLDGAINVDFESASFRSDVAKLDPRGTYFIYCRSGNRSGQAVTVMHDAGIKNITELSGGIIANQGTLKLVTGTPGAKEEYVVDPSDTLDGATLATAAPASTHTDKEIAVRGMIR